MNFVVATRWTKTTLVAVAIGAWTSQGAAQERPKFEVATVKPAAPNAVPRNQIVPTSPNRLYIPSMTLSWLIYTAYGGLRFERGPSPFRLVTVESAQPPAAN
jgi:hypothetical protein